jgi:hypothetical protein
MFYSPQYLELRAAKNFLKGDVTRLRYELEVGGFDLQIRNSLVRIDTSRESRANFNSAYLLMEDPASVSWKFGDVFLTLDKDELGNVVKAIHDHVQHLFKWEMEKHEEIDAVKDHDELDEIEIK